ncbi:hypothetical protein ACFL1V_09510 [Pseudomonadota bacterium]
MTKDLIIHIGSAKTGSTSLAKFLKQNSSFLDKVGICYPKMGRYASNDHYHLFSSVLPDEWYAAKKVGSFEEEWVPVVHELDHAFENGVKYGLLSFSGFLQFNQEHLEKISDLLSEFNVRIVYYVRRQDKLLLSVISQGMKAGDPDVHDVESGIETYTHLLDFAACIEPFEKVFGPDKIQILPFEKSQMVGGDIIQDFFSKVFCLDPKQEQAGEFLKENIGLIRDALEFKMRLNCLSEPSIDLKKYQSMLERYSSKARKDNESLLRDESILSPKERLKIIRQYEGCNVAIAQKYLGRPDGKLFYDPLPDQNESWQQYPGLTLSKCVEIADFLVHEILNDAQIEKVKNTPHATVGSPPELKNRVHRILNSIWKRTGYKHFSRYSK